MTDETTLVPRSLAVYLVYQDVALVPDWLVGALGFFEQGRFLDAGGVVTNAELAAGETVLLLERGAHSSEDYPRGTRWTGVWVDGPDDWYRQLIAIKVEASPPEDEPWGVRLVRVVDPEGHIWALIRRSSTHAST